MVYNSVEAVVGTLAHAYYDERNIDEVLSCVTDDIEWIGTENDDSAKGKDNLRELLKKDVADFPSPFSVVLEKPSLQQCSDDVIMLTIKGKQLAIPGVVAGLTIRGNACCVRINDSWLIRNIHVSVPNWEIEKNILTKELDENKKQQQALLAGMPGGVVIYRMKKDQTIVRDFVSEGMAKLCGYDNANEFLTATKKNALYNALPEDVPQLVEIVKKSIQNKTSISTAYHIYKKDRSLIYIRLDANLIETALEGDDIAMWYAVHTLVSEKAQRAQTEQEYFRMILDITNISYFEMDEKGCLYTSESFSKYKVSDYGLPVISIGENVKECFHPDDINKFNTYIEEINEGNDTSSVIVRMLMKNGRYQWTEITAHVEYGENHFVKRMMGVLRDVNPEWEKQKKTLEKALEETKKANQAKTDFLSRVSHDMRTPLNGILGLTTLLKDSVKDGDILKDLSELEMSGQYLLNLINDTLDMSRIESGSLELHPVVCNGRTLFNNTIQLGKMSMKGRNIQFNVQMDDIPFVLLYVDVSRFEQIVLNVLGNAIKFTPDGGSISVSLTNISVENGIITDRLVISDTGIGISKEFLPHIFEAFAQEDTSRTNNTQGTGLGMSITKQLLQCMGGDITVESELGKGSKFTLIIKLQMATEEQINKWKKANSVSVNTANLEGMRILLCEDHPLNTQIAIRLLKAKGIKVEHAENGQTGIDMFRKSIPNYYDAILMDIRMPIKDGIEATKEIRMMSRPDAKTIPIIAMTANAFADDIEQTQKAGMNAHLSKPIERDILYATLMKMISES